PADQKGAPPNKAAAAFFAKVGRRVGTLMSEDTITELTTTVLRKSKGRTLEDGDRLLVHYQGK
ncbi:MAG: hypothetical protein O2972_09865, partial [Cyanobacteria bacterium]|nr:hypothetical protein [Cyanobacteriota bacterium]